MVEEPASSELFADVGKSTEKKAMKDLVEVRIDEKNPDKFFCSARLCQTLRE